MKRFLLPASALVLVVAACGAGAKPAPRVTQVEARSESVPELVAQRRRAALREARRLVREFVPPPAARRDRARRDHGGILHQSGRAPFGEVADAHRFWRVRKPLAAVVAFVKAHDPPGFVVLDSVAGTQQPHPARYVVRTLGSPAADGRKASRYLDETIAGLPGRTVIRVEARVAWVYPRSPGERVPPSTRRIVLRAPRVSLAVSNPAKVARIIRWFDALPVFPPGVGVACPLLLRPEIGLSFRSATGVRLARATVPVARAGVCDPIGFKIGARVKKPLIDAAFGLSFARRLQRLLGLHLGR